jgi:hypothetical protein
MSKEGNHPTPPPPQNTPRPAGGEASPMSWWFGHRRRNQESTGKGTGSGSPDPRRSELGLGETSGNTADPKPALINGIDYCEAAEAARELVRDTPEDLVPVIIIARRVQHKRIAAEMAAQHPQERESNDE